MPTNTTAPASCLKKQEPICQGKKKVVFSENPAQVLSFVYPETEKAGKAIAFAHLAKCKGANTVALKKREQYYSHLKAALNNNEITSAEYRELLKEAPRFSFEEELMSGSIKNVQVFTNTLVNQWSRVYNLARNAASIIDLDHMRDVLDDVCGQGRLTP